MKTATETHVDLADIGRTYTEQALEVIQRADVAPGDRAILVKRLTAAFEAIEALNRIALALSNEERREMEVRRGA